MVVNGFSGEGFGQVFVNYDVRTDGSITFTFTEAVEQLSNVKGDIEFLSQLNLDVVNIENDQVAIPQIQGGNLFVLHVNGGTPEATIKKLGNSKPYFSPTEIEWTVEVETGFLENKNGQFTDPLPEGLTFVEGSLKVDGQPVANTGDLKKVSVNLGNFKGKKQ